MGLILDTSVLIAAERRKFDLAAFRLSLNDPEIWIASITLSELWHGCHRGRGPALANRLRFVQQIESTLPVLDFTSEEAGVHARLWAGMEDSGERIGPHDLIIAATALTHHHAMATLNPSEFQRVPGLELAVTDPYRKP